MLAFAEREFILTEQQEDGATTRDHLVKMARVTGMADPLLATAPPLPHGASHVWRWFIEARQDCKPGERITGALLQSVEWALGVKMLLWERSAIRRLDSLLQRVRHDRRIADN